MPPLPRIVNYPHSARFAGGVGVPSSDIGAVTQPTSKATGVQLDKIGGRITMNAASLAADTTVAFTLTNNQIQAGDHVLVSHESVGALGSYQVTATPNAGSALISLRNVTIGALAEAIVLRFSVIKGS